MEISQRQRRFNQNRIKIIIAKTKDKINNHESIKKELFILREVYSYLKQINDDSIETTILLDKVIPEFINYQNKYEESRKEKRLRKMKLQKQTEYKEAWCEKSLMYKIVHRKMNPSKIDFMQISHETIEENIEKLVGKKK